MAVEELFVKSGAVLQGHFLLSSGLHSPTYWEKFRVLESPRYTEELCGMIARRFRPLEPQVAMGAVTGGIILAYEVARQLGIRALFVETEGDRKVLRRGFRIGAGERVLVVDDVLTTGGSVHQVMDEVARWGARTIGVGVLVDRSGGALRFGVPFYSCHRVDVLTYRPEDCPLCRQGMPLVKPGSSEPKAPPAP